MLKFRGIHILGCILICLFLLSSDYFCYADEYDDIKNDLLGEYSAFYSDYISNEAGDIINNSFSNYSNDFKPKDFLEKIVQGEIPFNLSDLLKRWGLYLFDEILYVIKSMMFVVALAVIMSFFSNMSISFGKELTNDMAYYVCFIATVSIASRVFLNVQSSALDAIENLVLFMRCIVPVILTSLAASGAVISTAALEPFLIGIIQISLTLIKSVFFPLTMVACALGIVNSLSDTLKTDGLITLINKSIKYGLSVILTIFVAFAGIKSIAASGADALTLKLTKFASSNLIPVVGGILSESVETVMKCSAVIKNSLGIFGVITVFFIAVIPILKIMASLIVFRLCSAVCEPIGASGTVKCISSMANGISMTFSYLAAVEIMFIIILTIMINISLM